MNFNIDTIIGIDPGASGGLAVFQPGKLTRAVKMPKNIQSLRDFLAYYAENFRPVVFLEKLSVRPDDVKVEGEQANLGKLFRVQKMMENYYELKTIIETAGIPFIQVHPVKWQTSLKLRKLGSKEEKRDRKKRYQRHAAGLYPEVKVTLWNADALLIMHFGRWALINDPNWVREQLPGREYDKLF